MLDPNEAIKMSQNSEKLYSPLENKSKLETDYEVVEEKLIENTKNVNSGILVMRWIMMREWRLKYMFFISNLVAKAPGLNLAK